MERAEEQEELNRGGGGEIGTTCEEAAVGWISVLARVRYKSSEECLTT
jgi:hypothetical protein